MKNLTPKQRAFAGMVTWEAQYFDGTVLRETQGGKYQHIDRSQLKTFRIVAPGEVLLELRTGDGRTGQNLCYRRRNGLNQGGGKVTWFVAGWVPMGPAYAVDVANEEIYVGPGFVQGDKILYPPDPIPEAGENFVFSSKVQKLDAILHPHTITLPSGFVMKTPK